MERFELIELFNKYLKREPKPDEFQWHLGKNYLKFKDEILNCYEYFELQKNLPKPECKIAILISGHVRNNNIKNSLDLLKNYNYDVFVHTWDNIGTKGRETNLDDYTDSKLIENELMTIPNLKKYKIENNKKFINELKQENVTYFNYSSPENFIKSQLYSISESYKIFEEYSELNGEKYDIVIRTRFENEFTSFTVDEDLLHNIENYNVIFLPNKDCNHHHPDSDSTTCQVCEKMFHEYKLKDVHFFDHTHVICDIFAYGNVNAMKTYCSLYKNYDTLNKVFESSNKKAIVDKNLNYTINDNVYLMEQNLSGHLNSLYYVKCSYPERLLQYQLKDYILPTSSKIKINWKR